MPDVYERHYYANRFKKLPEAGAVPFWLRELDDMRFKADSLMQQAARAQGEYVVGFEINDHLRAMGRDDVCERMRRKYGKLVKFRA